jgi:hypothetical protein
MRQIIMLVVLIMLPEWGLGQLTAQEDDHKPPINLIAIGYDLESNPAAQKMLQEMTQAVKDSGGIGETIFAGKEGDHLDLAMGQAMNLATGQAATPMVASKTIDDKTVIVLAAPPMDNLLFAGFRGRYGKTYRIRLVGQTTGQVWGTDVYSDRSHPATAAVHAGVLKVGEQGIVSITILPGRPRYTGSSRNGVMSRDESEYPGSFTFSQK